MFPCEGRSLSLHVNVMFDDLKYRVCTLQELFSSAILSTWFLWAHLTLLLLEIDGDGTPAVLFLGLFLLEQHRYVEIAWYTHRNQRQGYVWKWDLEPPRFSSGVDPCCPVNCSICWEDIDRYEWHLGEWVFRIACRHQFHRHCLVSWLEKGVSQSCPMCRQRLLWVNGSTQP